MASYIARYQAGEREQVWAELTALGEQVRQEHILPDALAVAYETMSRVRENVQRIIPRLQRIPYDFDCLCGLDGPYVPPPGDIKDQVARLERLTGQLPLSLRAWYEVGGSVDLTGFQALWPNVYTDPLVIEPIELAFHDFQDWQEQFADEEVGEVGPFLIPVAPDFYFKNNFSGGSAYAIQVPDSSADALVLNEWHDTTFVSYLRECFRWGGFPGFDVRHPMNPQHLTEGVVMPPQHLALLTSDLLPI